MRLAARLCLGFALGAGLLAASGVAVGSDRASPAASPARVIDRTLLCTTNRQAGVRSIDVEARSGVRSAANPSKWNWLPSASVQAFGPEIRTPGQAHLGGISAGGPTEDGLGGHASIGVKQCKATVARVSLSARRLTGGVASQIGDDYECSTPRIILVRVRAVFRSPVILRLDRGWGAMRTDGTAREAYLAVRTQAGKPLVFASASESGRARLFIAESCV